MYKIYISTFGQRAIRLRYSEPLEVGAALRSNFVYPLKDNTGDNISSKNPCYGELTGLYWVWKNTNIADDDVIGFCHYNKCLDINKEKAIRWLAENPTGMITLFPGKIRNHPVPKECKKIIQNIMMHVESSSIVNWLVSTLTIVEAVCLFAKEKP